MVSGGSLFNRVANAVKGADPKKVTEALPKPDDVMKAIKDVDPQKAASEALKRPEATKVTEVAKQVGAKVDITVKDPSGSESPPTTTTLPGQKAEETSRKVKETVEDTGLSKLLQGKGPKDLADALKVATPKKVVSVLQGTDAKKVAEAVSQDASKVASALQDTTPKDLAEALKSGNSTKSLGEATSAVKAAIDNRGTQKVVDAVQGADPKKLAGAVQDAASAVRGVGSETVAKTLQETSPQDVAQALHGASQGEVKDAIKHPSADRLKEAIAKISAVRGEPSKKQSEDGADEPSISTPSSSGWLLVVLLLLAAAVIGGWFAFRTLTRPKHVGSPILQEANGTDMTVMPGSWMGMGGARDFISQQPAPGFQRF